MKYLIWIILLIVLFWLMRPRRTSPSSSAASHAQPSATRAALQSESMLCCAHCGVHFPASEAVTATASASVYCSDEHRRLHVER